MRLSDNNTPLIGRRRGTSASKGRRQDWTSLNLHSIMILMGIFAAILFTSLFLVSHLPDKSTPESSPLLTATQNQHISPAEIQNLILESARAESIERKEREEALDRQLHGDGDHFLRIKGKPIPGEENYNPHRGVDDPTGGGDGALYAEDHGMHFEHEGEDVKLEEKEDMHNHFVEAMKKEVIEGEKRVVQSLGEKLNHLKGGVEGVMKHGLLRGKSGEDAASGTGTNIIDNRDGSSKIQKELSYYPYMTSPVSESYDFSKYEPLGGDRFVEYRNGDSPYEITQSLRTQSDELARSRRVHVLNAMKHIWKNYKEKAFGRDELHPVSGSATSNWGGMGTTLVDALDTLWLMGLKDEFWEGRDWVRDKLSHSNVGDVSGFETTIRSLGGLLSAYDLSGDRAFLEKAEDLGSRLFKAYDTKSGLPRGSVNLQSGSSHNFGWNGNQFILAEVGTQQLEYRFLARATGKEEYAKRSEKVFDILNDLMPGDGLLGEGLKEDNTGGAYFSKGKVSFGAMGDSTYEYMIKLWIQGGRKEQKYRDMWDRSMNGVHDQLIQKSKPNGLTYIADRVNGKLEHKMDHLACFMGGALAIGAYTDPNGLDSARAMRDLKTAKALTYTCYQMYARSKTGISPEYVDFNGQNDFTVPQRAPFYILRPEAVEAFYYLSTLTGDPIYREWGWEVFQSIEKYCKTKYGYGSLKNVNDPSMKPEDRMESFFLAETLKYLYLLFDPDSEIDILNKHVFNTEAHPLKVFEISR